MLRIAHVIAGDYWTTEDPDKGIAGGVHVYTRGLTEALADANHNVTVLAFSSTKPNCELNGVNIRFLPAVESMYFRSEIVHAWLTENPQDLVEAHQMQFPLLIEQLVGGTPTVVRYATDLVDSARVLSAHFGLSLPWWNSPSRQIEMSDYAAEIHTLKMADLVLAGSQKQLRRAEHDMELDRVLMVPLGFPSIDTDLVPLSRPPNVRPHVLISLTRFTDPRKGAEFAKPMLEILHEERPDFEVKVLGSGSPARLNLPSGCVVQGPVSIAELDELYCWADAVVVPTKSESFGLCLLEPMKFGRPVVCFDLAGVTTPQWPVISVGSPSEPNAPRRLIEGLYEALETGQEAARVIRRFASKHEWQALVPDYVTAYERAICLALARGRLRGW